MSGVRLFDSNFISPDIVSNAYVSSQQTLFPVTNIYNFSRRSKVWRSNGYWNITTSNNKIVFSENGGGNLTATLTADEYDNTTLAAHIKTKMEDAGAGTYTVSCGTSGLSIAVAGLTTFNLKCNHADMSGFATLFGFTLTEKTGALSYTPETPYSTEVEWFKWDFGISTNPQAFALIGPRNTPLRISPTATITLQGSETDAWTTPSFSTSVSYDDRGLFVTAASGIGTEAYRYWRLVILDRLNPNGFIEAGSVYLGSFVENTRGAVQFPFNSRYIDMSVTQMSEGGQTYSDILPKSEEFDLSWFALTTSEKEELDTFFDTYGTHTAFFVQVDPDLAFSSTQAQYIKYVKLTSPPSYSLTAPGVWEMNMNVREEL